MGRQMRRVLVALAIGLAVSAPAWAQTSGNETFNGVIVASGLSGDRAVVNSVVVARGVFNGVGRIVEVDNLPGDPDNVSRDDLVFADGSIHIVSTTVDVSFSVNPRSCTFRATVQQTGEVVGGTGQFAAATGSSTATVVAHGLARRTSDGSCSVDQAPLVEVDTIASSGTFAF
jgi:hypothetical protein